MARTLALPGGRIVALPGSRVVSMPDLFIPTSADVFSYTETAWSGTTTPKTVTGQSWTDNAVIIVIGGLAAGGAILQIPTNPNLTFTQAAYSGYNAADECTAWAWKAVAGSAQTGQTITGTRTGTVEQWGMAVLVIENASDVGVTIGNRTEGTVSLNTAAGSVVVYAGFDWNASAPGRTLAAGTGTVVEHSDDTVGGAYSWLIGTWEDTAAGTNAYGQSSYTGWKVAHVGIEILKA